MANRTRYIGPIPLPKTPNDKLAVLVFVLGGHLCVWYEIFHILPFYYQNGASSVIWFHYVFTVVCYINIYGNLINILMSKTSGETCVLPTLAPEGWKYCERCLENYPPRSHHCKLCDKCVLKRDHHCWFAGSCIGYTNHRYYLVMITYCWLVAVYANIFNFEFNRQQLGGFGFGTWFCILFPHVCFTFGYLSWYEFFITSLTSIGLLLLFMFSYLLYAQIMQIIYGQTKYERKINVRKYDLGFKDNLVEVTGNAGLMVFMWPWIRSKLKGDGTAFREQKAK